MSVNKSTLITGISGLKVIWSLRMSTVGMCLTQFLNCYHALNTSEQNTQQFSSVWTRENCFTYDIFPNSVVENLFPDINIYIFRHNFPQFIFIRKEYSFTSILFNMTLEICCHSPFNSTVYENFRSIPNSGHYICDCRFFGSEYYQRDVQLKKVASLSD